MAIEIQKQQSCNTHLILGKDACDKVFHDADHKLLSLTTGGKAFCPTSMSIHMLGEFATSKLLSPSHATHTVTLCTEFIEWLEGEGDDRRGFACFPSDRIGLIAEIASHFLSMKDLVLCVLRTT